MGKIWWDPTAKKRDGVEVKIFGAGEEGDH